jgi:hypothetical protein
MIRAGLLDGDDRVTHAFFTREGGVSGAPYDSLNCGLGSNDDPEAVRTNRARAMARLGLGTEALATVYQIHSTRVVAVERSWPAEARPQADGLVTRTPGLAIGILTADCVPVLLADADGGVVGAAHAGWRGALDGVLEAIVAAMIGLGARRDRLCAAVGPCIRQNSYEVGAELRARFVADDPASDDHFAPAARPGHFQFDLPGYVVRRLAGLEVGAVDALPHDTLADEERFFSFRRTTKAGGGDYGRQLSAIALSP